MLILDEVMNLYYSNITFDKFHTVQHLNKAMDTVRKDERKGNDLLKNHKYTYLRLNRNLTDCKFN